MNNFNKFDDLTFKISITLIILTIILTAYLYAQIY
jgi:hypothetical protein